jgi:hypothetical protein
MIIQLASPSGLLSDQSHQVLCLLILPTKLIYFYNHFFPNYVYPNPPCQVSLWEETGAPRENPRLSAVR